jgi:hypothetical protein
MTTAMPTVAVPQPIDTAPKNGGWILGHVPVDPAKPWRQPWMILTWGDEGWVDANDYNPQEPVSWVPLPDPQPEPTSWAPAEGTIVMQEITGKGWTCNGKPCDVPWRWEAYIEKLDGSIDEYRELWHYATIDEAQARATKWQQRLSLPIVVRPLPSNVVPFKPTGALQ